jgi:quercetin dioxygenase-like cupin family protein
MGPPSNIQADSVSDLRKPTFLFTGHDQSSGKSIVQEKRQPPWTVYDDKLMAFNVVYTTSEFPANLSDDTDIKQHDAVMASNTLGLVKQNGTVCRIVDFAPGFNCMMHRTQSLDYGVVLEGSIELVLDSGDTELMSRGDVAVQRGTMHAWRNPSATQWARMLFVLQDCQKITLGGQALKEDLGRGIEGLPASGNDA